ncbi:hypothetical protein HDU91_005511 [Kappamyces sp. JEL0680]|nr:hypothetical protein HDU91_005511 [Kappamyces sp. JEL0680]
MSALISSTVSKTASFALSLAKKTQELLAPVTPRQVTALIDATVDLTKRAYEKPYETSKEWAAVVSNRRIVPARVFNAGEHLWTSYGAVALSKTQAVAASASGLVGRGIDNTTALVASVRSYITGKVSYVYNVGRNTVGSTVEYASKTVNGTVGYVQGKVKQSSDYTVSLVSSVQSRAGDLVKSFSKAA